MSKESPTIRVDR